MAGDRLPDLVTRVRRIRRLAVYIGYQRAVRGRSSTPRLQPITTRLRGGRFPTCPLRPIPIVIGSVRAVRRTEPQATPEPRSRARRLG
jgi:hypothetical protein